VNAHRNYGNQRKSSVDGGDLWEAEKRVNSGEQERKKSALFSWAREKDHVRHRGNHGASGSEDTQGKGDAWDKAMKVREKETSPRVGQLYIYPRGHHENREEWLLKKKKMAREGKRGFQGKDQSRQPRREGANQVPWLGGKGIGTKPNPSPRRYVSEK